MNSLDKFPFSQFKFNSDSIFRELPKADLEILNSNTRTRLYKKKQIIFYEDSPTTGIYYVKEGLVKKYRTGRDGKEQIFYISKSGDLIGFHSILSDENYFDSAAAMEDSVISFIPKDIFLNLIAKSPQLTKLLLKSISHEFGVLLNTITIISQMSVRERLAFYLLILKEKFYDINLAKNKKTEIKISRDNLAAIVGTAKESVVRLLHNFKEDNIIETNGKVIVITDVKALVNIVIQKGWW